MGLPIIFIHRGYSSYLEFSLRQAKHTNPESEIILLGDDTNNRFPFITHVNIKDYFKKAEEFARIYKHYSTNPYNYELFCFQRWFILEEFAESAGLTEMFVCDSDILLYSNIDMVLRVYYSDTDLGIMYDSKKEVYNAALSFWKVKILSDFTRSIILEYSDINELEKMQLFWKETISRKQLGGISDMVAVANFCKKNEATIRIESLTKTNNGMVFENSIGLSECFYELEYKMKFNRKVVIWRNGTPYGYSLIEKSYVQFSNMHFQGPAKYLMAKYYTGPTFKGQTRLTIVFYLLNFMAFWYKTLKIRYRFAFIFDLLFRSSRKAG